MLKPLLLVSLTALPHAVHAAPCANSGHVAAQLSAQFSETIQMGGVLSNGNIVIVHTNRDRSSWTMLIALPDRDISCLIATGSGSDALEAQLSTLGTG